MCCSFHYYQQIDRRDLRPAADWQAYIPKHFEYQHVNNPVEKMVGHREDHRGILPCLFSFFSEPPRLTWEPRACDLTLSIISCEREEWYSTLPLLVALWSYWVPSVKDQYQEVQENLVVEVVHEGLGHRTDPSDTETSFQGSAGCTWTLETYLRLTDVFR